MSQTENDTPSAETCFQRGELLRRQSRMAEAAQFYQQALAADPHHVQSLAMLALCWMSDESKKREAVDAAQRAVSLEPEVAFYHGVLALTISHTAKEGFKAPLQQALAEAKEAVRLEPYNDFTHAVEAQIQLRLRKYPEAEAAAKRALQRNTENTAAAEVLSIALLQQRKDEDNADLVRYQLDRNPEDSSSHTSAGWLALRTGDHKQANQHFLEALRLDPMNESARLGLVESYRARSSIYRAFIAFAHMMSQFTEGRQTAIAIGGVVAYNVLRGALSKVSPFLASLLMAVWLTFVLWSHLARGFSSFLMLFDGYARRSLRRREVWEGIAVGGMTALALVLLALSFRWVVDGQFAALALLFSAVVCSASFTNEHYIGKHIFDVAAFVATVCAFYFTAAILLHLRLPGDGTALSTAVIFGVAAMWMRGLRIGYS